MVLVVGVLWMVDGGLCHIQLMGIGMVTGSLTIKSGVSHLSWESWSFIGISGWENCEES